MSGVVEGRVIGNERLRISFSEPGIHPFISFLLPEKGGGWSRALILGARHLWYHHKGASFPRLVSGGQEEEAGAKLEFSGDAGDGRAVRISDIRGGFEIESLVSVEGDGCIVHVEHVLKALTGARLNRAFDRYDFVAAPAAEPEKEVDFWYAPHLRPKQDMVIGDHVFRSPVILASRGDLFFALFPDLEALEGEYARGDARYYMDFLLSGGENRSPAACFGLGRTRTKGHVYFEGDFGGGIDVAAGESMRIAYYLMVGEGEFGEEDALSFMWERFARRYLESGLPQVVGWDRYASAGLSRMFKRSDLFMNFQLEGQHCGGTVAQHLITRRGVRLMGPGELKAFLRFQDLWLAFIHRMAGALTGSVRLNRLLRGIIYRSGPKVPPQVLFQSWFNNLRSAYGAYWFGRRWGDHALVESALAVKNLAILAPREEGAFPAVCYVTDEGIKWCRGTKAFKHVDYYHTADNATTAYYMALWFRDHEGDPRLLGRCREYAESLLKVQLPSGAFPAWVRRVEPPLVLPELKESATAACPAMFLALLYEVDGDGRYLESARRAADFLAAEVIPRNRWFDYETFYSCSPKKFDMFDRFTGIFPENLMSVIWAAEALRLVYLGTGDESYLRLGVRVLSHMCLYQQVWDPPFLSINGFGGFCSQNSDAEWNDARQALAVPVLMDYYALTGKPEYMERGTAALRASFTTMYLEENRKVAPGNMETAPASEFGSVAENYGHSGIDFGTPGFLESDWGAGSACQAAAYTQKHYGDIFVDFSRKRAFGINGCRVRRSDFTGDRVSIDAEKQVQGGLDAVVRVSGDVSPRLEIEVNGSRAGKTPDGGFVAVL